MKNVHSLPYFLFTQGINQPKHALKSRKLEFVHINVFHFTIHHILYDLLLLMPLSACVLAPFPPHTYTVLYIPQALQGMLTHQK